MGDAAHLPLQHAHAFHMRYYHSALEKQQLDQITLRTPPATALLPRRRERALRSRAHEPEPRRRGDLSRLRPHGRVSDLKGNLVEMVHDPLGVELLLNGTIRNVAVQFQEDRPSWRDHPALRDRFAVQQQVFPAQSGDRNTLRIGVVVIGKEPGSELFWPAARAVQRTLPH